MSTRQKVNNISILQTIKALESRGFRTNFVNNKKEAKDIILKMLPENSTIGIGDSTTLTQIEVIPEIKLRGYRVSNPFQVEIDQNSRKSFENKLRESLFQDIFITGANVVTKEGMIISIDAGGNRVAGTIFTKKVILVVGQNKIVENLNEAFQRIREVIAPEHAKNKNFNVPCVKTGKCVDCRAKERICNVMMILEGKPFRTEVEVIIIGEDLGLGWDPKWTNKRIDAIRENYIRKCWKPTGKVI